ncbi:hypothetical protein GLAREA_03518 [Glarea lozoyensis ATCC 20868]|uniref:Uncharacterized protein n=1 Tax=Glarea lozoyensis (strain ATCC 20868 / MF5171) TaxID=1116229 RepID=S3DEY5_GLAL2|nr:uncharacterized protein GLAREA_03518 [Glarea lozoyensis ATCC 20868]EPE30551.1 hypothetical protein GLAREA_03518 [Glarea lozoyensis ATCC 20868]
MPVEETTTEADANTSPPVSRLTTDVLLIVMDHLQKDFGPYDFPRDIRRVCRAWNDAAIPYAYANVDLTRALRKGIISVLWSGDAVAGAVGAIVKSNTRNVLLGQGRKHIISDWRQMNAFLSRCQKLENITFCWLSSSGEPQVPCSPSTLDFGFHAALNFEFPTELVNALPSTYPPNVTIGFPNCTPLSKTFPILQQLTQAKLYLEIGSEAQKAMELLLQSQRLETVGLALHGDFSAEEPKRFRESQRILRDGHIWDDASQGKLVVLNWPRLRHMDLVTNLKCLTELLKYFEPDLHPVTQRLIDNHPQRLKEVDIEIATEGVIFAEPALKPLSAFVTRLNELTVLKLNAFDSNTIPMSIALQGDTLKVLRLVGPGKDSRTFFLDPWALRLIITKCRVLQELALYVYIENRKSSLLHICTLPLLTILQMEIKGNNIPYYNRYHVAEDLLELMTTMANGKTGLDFRKEGEVMLTSHNGMGGSYTLALRGSPDEAADFLSLLSAYHN